MLKKKMRTRAGKNVFSYGAVAGGSEAQRCRYQDEPPELEQSAAWLSKVTTDQAIFNLCFMDDD